MKTPLERRRVLVWDLPTRLFHWLLASSFVVAFATADSERWRDLHVLAGYTMLSLVAFRVLWGVVGSRYARFVSFPPAPSRALAYLRELARGRASRFVGHNPAGALAIYALLAMTVAAALSGLATFNEFGGHAMEEIHEATANALLALVGVHLAGVLVGSLAHRENLAKSMLTGYKWGGTGEAIARHRIAAAVLLAAAVTALWTGVLPAPGLDIGPSSADRMAAPADAKRSSQSEHQRLRPEVDAHPRS